MLLILCFIFIGVTTSTYTTLESITLTPNNGSNRFGSVHLLNNHTNYVSNNSWICNSTMCLLMQLFNTNFTTTSATSNVIISKVNLTINGRNLQTINPEASVGTAISMNGEQYFSVFNVWGNQTTVTYSNGTQVLGGIFTAPQCFENVTKYYTHIDSNVTLLDIENVAQRYGTQNISGLWSLADAKNVSAGNEVKNFISGGNASLNLRLLSDDNIQSTTRQISMEFENDLKNNEIDFKFDWYDPSTLNTSKRECVIPASFDSLFDHENNGIGTEILIIAGNGNSELQIDNIDLVITYYENITLATVLTCNNEKNYTNTTVTHPNTENLEMRLFAYRCVYGSASGVINNLERHEETRCHGAYSCYNIQFISFSQTLAAHADHGVGYVSNISMYNNSVISCRASHSCSNSVVLNGYSIDNDDDNSPLIQCYGSRSCYKSEFYNMAKMVGWYAPFSMEQSKIRSNGHSDLFITIRGFFAAYNGSIVCDGENGISCVIYCYSTTGCLNMSVVCGGNAVCSIDCSGWRYTQCPNMVRNTDNVTITITRSDYYNGSNNSISSDEFLEIMTPYWNQIYNKIDDVYNGIYNYNNDGLDDIICNESSTWTFDEIADVVDSSVGVLIANGSYNYTSICCRYVAAGTNVCQRKDGIIASDNIMCSGNRGCQHTSLILAGNNVICSGLTACATSSTSGSDSIIASGFIFCDRWSCMDRNLFNANSLYCLSENSCESTSVYGIKNIYLLDGTSDMIIYSSVNLTQFDNSSIVNDLDEEVKTYFDSAIRDTLNKTNIMSIYFMNSYDTIPIVTIYCQILDQCYVQCSDADVCLNTTVYCQGEGGSHCYIRCEPEIGIACPTIIGNNYTISNYTESTIPTVAPTAIPTMIPSTVPSSFPTVFPTMMPTDLPSVVPSSMPSSIPTSITSSPSYNPTYIPTEAPTPNANSSTLVISSNSINFDEFGCSDDCYFNVLDDNTYFNPGYRTVFHASVEIELTNNDQIELFEQFDINEDESALSIDIIWNVYVGQNDSDSSSYMLYFNGSSNSESGTSSTLQQQSGILTYDSGSMTNKSGIATYQIESYFILYNSQGAINTFSKDICNYYNEQVFQSTRNYLFENVISLKVNSSDSQIQTIYQVSKKESVALVANSQASRLINSNESQSSSCFVIPDIESYSLFDTQIDLYCVNLSQTWYDHENSSLFINFLFDDSKFLLNEYVLVSEIDGAEALVTLPNTISFGNHTITPVIIDNMTLATCNSSSEISFKVNKFSNDTSQALESDISTFVDWWNDFILDLFLDANTTQKMVFAAETGYDVLELYIDHTNINLNYDEVSQLTDLQETVMTIVTNYTQQLVLDYITNASSDSHTGIDTIRSEMGTLITTMGTITAPLSVVSSVVETTVNQDTDTMQGTMYSKEPVFDILAVLDNILSNIFSGSISSDTGLGILTVNSNSMEVMSYSNENDNIYTNDEFGDFIVAAVVDVGEALLANAIVGECFDLSEFYDSFDIKYSKISRTIYDECQIDNNIQLSQELVDTKSVFGEYNMNCIIMTTYFNIYNISQLIYNPTKHRNDWQADFILLELNTDANKSNDDTVYLSECEPLVLTFNSNNVSWWGNYDTYDPFPYCKFYNETTERYEDNGCYVLYTTDNYTQCSCSHLTFFALTWQSFKPDINYEAVYIVPELEFQDFIDHPLGVIVSVSWVAVFVIAMVCWTRCNCSHDMCNCEFDDKPLLAHTNIVLFQKEEDYGTMEEMKSQYFQLIQYEILTSKTDPHWFVKLLKLWKIALQSNHIYLSLIYRHKGTHWTTNQRLAVIMARGLVSMIVGSLFFGIPRDSPVGDYAFAFYESFLGWLIVYPIKLCMKKNKPRRIELNERERQMEVALRTLGTQNHETENGDDNKTMVGTSYAGANQELQLSTLLAQPNVNGKDTKDIQDTKDTKDGKSSDAYKALAGMSLTSASSENDSDTESKESMDSNLGENDGNAATMLMKKEATKYLELREKRENMVNFLYYLNPIWKTAGYAFVIFLSICGICITSVMCIYFDTVELESSNYYYETFINGSQCVEKNDIGYQTWINYNETEIVLDELENRDWYQNAIIDGGAQDSYGENLSTSERFLLELLYSHLLSTFLWQPLFALVFSAMFPLIKYIKNPHRISIGRFFSQLGLRDDIVSKLPMLTMQQGSSK